MRKKVRALLLAGGLGTRLKPITDKLPKCMVTINEEPMIERWLTALEECECQKTIINTHYMPEVVRRYIKERKQTSMEIIIEHEEVLLGTAGTLFRNKRYYEETGCLVIHADNATNMRLEELIDKHQQRPEGCIGTMTTFTSKNPEECGIVEVNEQGIMMALHEKIKNPPGDKANAAIYYFDPEIFTIPEEIQLRFRDISLDLMPQLEGKMYTHHISSTLIDIGTTDRLQEAKTIFEE